MQFCFCGQCLDIPQLINLSILNVITGQIKQGDNIWEKGECIGAGMFGKVMYIYYTYEVELF